MTYSISSAAPDRLRKIALPRLRLEPFRPDFSGDPELSRRFRELHDLHPIASVGASPRGAVFRFKREVRLEHLFGLDFMAPFHRDAGRLAAKRAGARIGGFRLSEGKLELLLR